MDGLERANSRMRLEDMGTHKQKNNQKKNINI